MAVLYMRLVRLTNRLDRPEPPPGGPFILATWHSRLFLLSYLRLGDRPLIALISGNRDGQLISKIARMFGIHNVAGSSSRGGTQAIRQMIRLSRDGHSIYITPDGPRGPAMKAQRGIVEIARLTGLPILPAAASTSSGGERNTWDRILVPYPFGRTVVRWGKPIRVDDNSDVATVCAKVENALTDLQQRVDRACGRPPVEPFKPRSKPRKLATSN
ncbi:MAG TPA: lysophospholipid acyltransferase family protein [Pseudolabrys sp.]|nr:lysophospholipid acyltransferase family protein [Pseudolabrys sp.]